MRSLRIALAVVNVCVTVAAFVLAMAQSPATLPVLCGSLVLGAVVTVLS